MSSKHYLQRVAPPRETRHHNPFCCLKWYPAKEIFSGTIIFLISDGTGTIGHLTLNVDAKLSGDVTLSTDASLKELPGGLADAIKAAMHSAEPEQEQLRLRQRRS
jgi:hypothetical protein